MLIPCSFLLKVKSKCPSSFFSVSDRSFHSDRKCWKRPSLLNKYSRAKQRDGWHGLLAGWCESDSTLRSPPLHIFKVSLKSSSPSTSATNSCLIALVDNIHLAKCRKYMLYHLHLGIVMFLDANLWKLFMYAARVEWNKLNIHVSGIVRMSSYAIEYVEISACNQFPKIQCIYFYCGKDKLIILKCISNGLTPNQSQPFMSYLLPLFY